MDGTVHTFEQVTRVLDYVTFSVPTPMVVVGLNNSTAGEVWPESPLFPGKKPGRFDNLSEREQERLRRDLTRETNQPLN